MLRYQAHSKHCLCLKEKHNFNVITTDYLKRKSHSTSTVLFQFYGPKYPVASEANVVAALDTFNMTLDASFRHSSVCLMTGPQPLLLLSIFYVHVTVHRNKPLCNRTN